MGRMNRKMITGLIVVVFVGISSLFAIGCAKKQVQAPEGIKSTASSEAEAARAREAERRARIEELEKSKILADEINRFQSTKIYFDFDRSDLKPEARNNLKKKAEWLMNNPSYTVMIEGHCDERGSNEYNLALGERRAHSAKKFLVTLGVSPDRISTISYGEERPADPGHNEEAWAKNRRDEFKLRK